jgi:hypothetical protein
VFHGDAAELSAERAPDPMRTSDTVTKPHERKVSAYCSLAVLTDDALGVLENVDVTKYHAYGYT